MSTRRRQRMGNRSGRAFGLAFARRFWRDIRGGSLVEIAFLIPLLVLLAIGGIEFGMIALHKMAANNAARACVQYGALDLTTAANTTGMEDAARDDLGNAADGALINARQYCYCPTEGEVACTATCADGSFTMMYVEVSVHDEYKYILGYPGIASTFPIDATAHMRVR